MDEPFAKQKQNLFCLVKPVSLLLNKKLHLSPNTAPLTRSIAQKSCSLTVHYLVDLGSLSCEPIPQDDGAFIVAAG